MGRLDLTFLLETGLYGDIHITCTGDDGREHNFKAHRAVIFAQCAKLKELALDAPVVSSAPIKPNDDELIPRLSDLR